MSVWGALKGSPIATGLSVQLISGEFAHAWLILGPPGSGKRSVALAMAAAVNCEVEPRVGCGGCSSCVRILRARHPDVHHVLPEGPLIPVDLIRDIVIPEASRSPFEAHFKIFIIEEAERMNEAAQNALLKTLEEPQPATIFFLISDQEDDLLDTIRSRCRILRLEPVSEERVAELLREAGAGEEDARLAARLSEGDLGRAQALAFDPAVKARLGVWRSLPDRLATSTDALDIAEEIIAESATAVKTLEAAQKAEVVEFADAIGEGRGTATARNALANRHKRELRRLQEEILGEALHQLASFYKDVVVLRNAGRDSVVNIDQLDELQSWAAADVSDRALLSAVSRCLSARAALPQNANPLLTLEATMAGIAGEAATESLESMR
ncbi:MAG: polymerase subunit delta [Actinomycetota bacterium]|jgi:DNA polymerase-3 subunit delta'|nr:polymerase subunit delta [Actinomycetota bacterium]